VRDEGPPTSYVLPMGGISKASFLITEASSSVSDEDSDNGGGDPKSSQDDGFKTSSDDGKKVDEDPSKVSECKDQEKQENVNSNNNVNTVSLTINVAGTNEVPFDLDMTVLEDIGTFDFSNEDEDDSEMANINNLDTTIQVSPTLTRRIHIDRPLDQVIRDLHSATQTRNMSKNLEEHGFVSSIQQQKNHKDLQNCLFACFLSQEEPKRDDIGNMIRNKARIVAQYHTQEEGIDYDKVFAPVARIEAIKLFLAYAKDFMVYQMDVKSAFLYGKIEKDVYVCQPLGFEDPDFPDRVYKVEKALYRKHQAPRAWYEIVSTYMLENGFQREKIDKTLFIKRHKGDILLFQVYVDDIIFGSTRKVLCNAFEKLMHEKFQMSSMGELTFFLGLQVKQKNNGVLLVKIKKPTESEGFEQIVDFMSAHTLRRDLRLADEEGVDCLSNSTIFENLELMGHEKLSQKLTFYKSFLSPQWEFLIHTILQYLSLKTTAWNEFSSTIESAIICLATNQKFNFSKLIFYSMIRNLDNASGKFLMYPRNLKRKNTHVPQPSSFTKHVTDEAVYKELGGSLVRATTASSSLEEKHDSVNDQDDAKMFDVTDLHGEEVFVDKDDGDKEVNSVGELNDASIATTISAAATITTEEVTLTKALAELKALKPKVKGVVIQEPSESTRTTTKIISLKQSQDKGKGIMVEEPVKPKKKDQIRLDEEAILKLQAELKAEFKEEQRLAREEA
nr:hypothetical protein [Tanacetum cinerariifolium]